MFSASNQRNVTLVCGPTDMRKAIYGLSNIVAYELLQEPCSEQLFVFCGRRRDRLKILQWVNNGLWLHYKRLEKCSFHWPGINYKQLGLAISARQPNWLVEGLPLQQEHAHPHLRYCYHHCLIVITTAHKQHLTITIWSMHILMHFDHLFSSKLITLVS